MFRFFVDEKQILAGEIYVEGSDVNHISKSLRLKVGDEIVLSDGKSNDYRVTIKSIERAKIVTEIIESFKNKAEPVNKISVFQGLPKQDKFELIIQKSVELGAYDIRPVGMDHCIAKLDKKKEEGKLVRWNNISQAAAKQSGRGIIPRVGELISFKQLLEEVKNYEKFFVLYERAQGLSFTRRRVGRIRPNEKIAFLVGPEGGISKKEIELLQKKGAIIVSLGRRILRTETAAASFLSILMFSLEEKL